MQARQLPRHFDPRGGGGGGGGGGGNTIMAYVVSGGSEIINIIHK